MTDTEIGRILQQARELESLTLRDMAKKLSISHAYLSRVEHGQQPLSGALLQKLHIWQLTDEEKAAILNEHRSRGAVYLPPSAQHIQRIVQLVRNETFVKSAEELAKVFGRDPEEELVELIQRELQQQLPPGEK